LLLAPGKLRWMPRQERFNAEELRHLLHATIALVTPERAKSEGDILPGSHRRKERGPLHH
jgi:hypothetical protein